MDKKTLHVVYGYANRGTLNHGLHLMGIKDELVCLPVDFSYRHMLKDFSDIELYKASFDEGNDSIYNDLKALITKDYTAYDRVIVWHGWGSADLFALYLMSVIVDDNLYHVDIRDCEVFMAKHLSRNPMEPFPTLGHVAPFDISQNNMVSLAKPISDEEKNTYIEKWYRWTNSNTIYRFSDTHDGIIKAYPADFMDAAILEIAKKESKISYVAAHVMYKFNYLNIPDIIVFDRILELICEGKLIIEVSLK